MTAHHSPVPASALCRPVLPAASLSYCHQSVLLPSSLHVLPLYCCCTAPQDDTLPGTLTVFEYLLFNAALKLPPTSHTSHTSSGSRGDERTAVLPSHSSHVWGVIKQLGLSKVAHSFIGDAWVRGLSGGEKRRVAIGVELLTRPGVLLLDEPTTGLDSTNAARVVDIMSGAAAGGVTCVMSIHQPRPDIFRLMHRLLLLSSMGEVGAVHVHPHAAVRAVLEPRNFEVVLLGLHSCEQDCLFTWLRPPLHLQQHQKQQQEDLQQTLAYCLSHSIRRLDSCILYCLLYCCTRLSHAHHHRLLAATAPESASC